MGDRARTSGSATMATIEVEPMVGQATDKECAKSEADIKENLMSQG